MVLCGFSLSLLTHLPAVLGGTALPFCLRFLFCCHDQILWPKQVKGEMAYLAHRFRLNSDSLGQGSHKAEALDNRAYHTYSQEKRVRNHPRAQLAFSVTVQDSLPRD